MKKIVCLLLLAAMIALTLCSCGSGSSNSKTDSVGTSSSDTKINYSEKKNQDPDVDENGNFILTSTENRIVYPYKDGYIVFKFSGETVNKVLRVLEFESEEAASEYITNNALDAIANGEVPDTLMLNGKYVYYTFKDQSEGPVRFYTMSRSQIISEFANVESK